jgi:hypothetical protein
VFFEQHHVAPGAGQPAGGIQSCGTAAHDNHLVHELSEFHRWSFVLSNQPQLLHIPADPSLV